MWLFTHELTRLSRRNGLEESDTRAELDSFKLVQESFRAREPVSQPPPVRNNSLIKLKIQQQPTFYYCRSSTKMNKSNEKHNQFQLTLDRDDDDDRGGKQLNKHLLAILSPFYLCKTIVCRLPTVDGPCWLAEEQDYFSSPIFNLSSVGNFYTLCYYFLLFLYFCWVSYRRFEMSSWFNENLYIM